MRNIDLIKIGAAAGAVVLPELCRYVSLSIFSKDKNQVPTLMSDLNFESAVRGLYKDKNRSSMDYLIVSALGALRVSSAYFCYKAFTSPNLVNATLAATLCAVQAGIGYALS